MSFNQEPIKHRNDPAKFFGDGVTFKAKLIGILEVGEARGDRMCQEALQDLKMAIRAAGEHKQRITIHVTIDGLRLRDEKTGDSLYHHPVHKISFIAQDMTDSRAFGYIFGSPDSGHRFFGIKTDKAASQVVLAMRDLFQVVFELKKKEIELARQHIQSKSIHDHTPVTFSVKNNNLDSSNVSYTKPINNENANKSTNKTTSPESVADLVDLEQELSSIQRGITQMERITPSEPTSTKTDTEDPFGDSFTTFPTYNLLPPPESSKSRHSKPLKPPEDQVTESLSTLIQPDSTVGSTTTNNITDEWLNASSTITTSIPTTFEDANKNLTTSNTNINENEFKSIEDLNNAHTSTVTTSSSTVTTSSKYIDAFTDLDPLGTGKNKPYVDKKYFFHDLKNPPKKVLKDLSGKDIGFTANFSTSSSILNNTDDLSVLTPSNEKLCDIDLKLFESNNLSNIENNLQTDKSINSLTSSTATTSFSNNNNRLDEISKSLATDLQDPFSNSKIDPFMDDDDFSKVTLDPFDFSFNEDNQTSNLTETKISNPENESGSTLNKLKSSSDDKNVFNGPLHVSLPPENWSSQNGSKKLERQHSETLNTSSSNITSFSSSTTSSTARNRPSVFKQNTVDVISSISSKKMMKPHLFGQKFSKRDSNSINMRRLQESDSLSENETAPEPPPRPETGSHVEPPPLPPKKQFSDIVIRPSPRLSNSTNSSSSSLRESTRYDFLSSSKYSKTQNENAPPLPLPSRKVGKTESSYPGPGRPSKKPTEEDDYLTPINKTAELPILLPPPQQKTGSKTRQNRKTETSTNVDSTQKIEKQAESSTPKTKESEPLIPDITLSQLLTLGIDDLAKKLNVPTSKLNTMTLVELTTYLSDFIEDSKNKKSDSTIINPQPSASPAVFKVNFDQTQDSTFIAKFDDTFGEENTFVANFDHFNEKPESTPPPSTSNSVSVDRYAVFREIIDQEMSSGSSNNQNEIETFETPVGSLTMTEDEIKKLDEESNISVTKIDTKITEVISQAKDRYAALRDIVLVEDLFDKQTSPLQAEQNSQSQEEINDENEPAAEVIEDKTQNEVVEVDKSAQEVIEITPEEPRRASNDNSPEINICPSEESETIEPELQEQVEANSMQNNGKDDLEIDAYMQRALSNLSLDSREHLSPIGSKTSPVAMVHSQNASTSPIRIQQNKSPSPSQDGSNLNIIKTTLNDMSTSPIPIQKSPASKSPVPKVLTNENSPPTQTHEDSPNNLVDSQNEVNTSNGISDGVSGSSPDENNIEKSSSKEQSNDMINESWAVFDSINDKPEATITNKKLKSPSKDTKDEGESPCSSDGKEEWKSAQEYSRRWPNGQTSSSSRDVSPWDEDTPEYRRRYHSSDKHGHHPRHPRRMNSCDEEYDDKLTRRRERRVKGPVSRSRENFESENWYHLNEQSSWSPPEDDEQERGRNFERSTYERSTYGPPYEKRDHKNVPMYDRRDYKNYDKRKYFRDYGGRPDYDFDPYSVEAKERRNYYEDEYERRRMTRKDYSDEIFESSFDRESRTSHKSGTREFFYDRDKRSFDRESVESYESNGRQRRSFGSGEIYGSLDSRGEFRGDPRHYPNDKSRSWKKGMRTRPDEEYEQDSENDVNRRVPGDTRSLQRPAPGIPRPRKSSGSSPWDGEDLTPTSASSKSGWKRPASASESERRLAETKRNLCNTLSGSDGEKDRRFRKKTRSRNEKEPLDVRQNYASLRYPRRRPDDYFDFDDSPSQMPSNRDPYFPDNDDDIPPRSADSVERQYYSKREQYFKNLTPRSETRSMVETLRGGPENLTKHSMSFGYDKDMERKKLSPRESYGFVRDKKFTTFDETPKNTKHVRMEFEFDEFEDTPQSTTSSKFNFDEEQGFESDFNSPTTNKNAGFRFSNDFSEKETTPRISSTSSTQPQSANTKSTNFQFESDFPTQTSNNVVVQSKLRFDDNVTISKFDSDIGPKQKSHQMFEDDFSNFEVEDKWNELPNKKFNNKFSNKQYENIRKSESVNIFAKKVDDPFEDDDFFQTNTANNNNNNNNEKNIKTADPFHWEKNFAKFDDNM